MFKFFKQSTAATILGVTAMVTVGTAIAGDLVVQVETLESTVGQLVVNVFDSADTFRNAPKKQLIQPAEKKNAAGQLSAVFQGLPAGEYAVLAFHDKDGDGKLGRNMVGIPNEPYSFSGQPAKYGPPSFKEAAFLLPPGGATITIKLK